MQYTFTVISSVKLIPMQNPIPTFEWQRLRSLTDYGLDYSIKDVHLDNLSKLASEIAETEISLVNLIDSHTQWSVSSNGLEIQQMPRDESVCQYTILEQEPFEVQDLSSDSRFKEKFYVAEDPFLKYYFGIPLINSGGLPLGALCVMDKKPKQLSDHQQFLLQLIAKEVVERLEEKKLRNQIQLKYEQLRLSHKKVAHDIRGPLGGIYGIAEIIESDIDKISKKEILEFSKLIQKSSQNLLELSDALMNQNNEVNPIGNDGQNLNLETLKKKLAALYTVQAVQKQVRLSIQVLRENLNIPFQKSKILQIIGNLISNAIKFTPVQGRVNVELDIIENPYQAYLSILVEDTGIGISVEKIKKILHGQSDSVDGTHGEQGYGFGLNLVKYLVESMHGEFHIQSTLGMGTTVKVTLPLDIP